MIGLLSERDVVNARDNCLLEGVQFVVAMPRFAREAIDDGSLDPTYLRFLGVDELVNRNDDLNQVVARLLARRVGVE